MNKLIYNTNKQAQWTSIVFNCVFVLFCLFLTPCYAYSSIHTGNVIESISYDSNAPQMACTMTCPSDVTINCGESTHPSNTGTASSDCGTPTYTDNSSGSCPQVITRTWTANAGNGGGNTCTPVRLARWNMNNCGSPYSDYSEFTANYPNSEQCLAVSASNVYLNQGQHSCNVGYNGSGAAMCIAYPNQISSFSDNHPNAVRLDITFNPDPGSTARFTGFNFREVSSSIVNVLVGNSYFPADVNYPRQYGIRILKNGQEIFQQTGINTSTNWSLENFDFSNNPAFTVSTSTLFEIELLPYNFTTTSNLQNTWDVDQLEVYGCSMSSTEEFTCTQTITVIDQAPIIANPAGDLVTECDGNGNLVSIQNWLDNNGSAIATDACSDVTWTNNYTSTLNVTCGNTASGIVTFTATDACGNIATTTALYTIEDTTPPAVTLPADITVCDIPAPINLSATDICADTDLSQEITDDLNGNILTRTWIITDVCNNSTTVSQTIAIDCGSIGNFVFEDLDKDGIQDANEPGVDGVVVKLLDGNGDLLQSTVTSNGGLYLFDDLAAGMYKVMVNAPDAYTITSQDQGGDDNTDSDINTVGMTDMIVLGISEDIRDVDAGIYLTDPANGSIGNFVFEDLDKDGIQDANEPGVDGVVVKLLDGNGDLLQSTVTSNGGLYLFDDLAAGMYKVMVNAPDAYTITSQDQGGDDNTDSDINTVGMTDMIVLGISEDIRDVDAGIYLTDPANGSIGNFVFEDLDKDGIQDANEPGVDGVVVKLLDGNGDLLQSTVTSNGGLYLFDDLAAGMYKVMVNAPDAYTITSQDQGGDDNTDSDINTVGMTDMIVLGISEDIRDVDAGIYLTDPANGSIGNFVFEDLDKDGIQDANETGVDGVVVKLLDGNGDLLQSTVTSNGGLYLFDDLAAGMYKVMVNAPDAYTITSQDQGGDDNTDSDINTVGMTDMIVLGISEDIRDVDAGIYLTDPANGSIGNFVFEDLDKDGIQDANETGVDGVVVKLLDGNGDLLQSTVTSNGGLYLFDDLAAGMYKVMVNAPDAYTITSQDQGGDDNTDSDINTVGMTDMIVLGISEDIRDVDAGIYLTDPADASIEGVVFTDDNKDGIQDPTEEGLENVEVKLLDENGETIEITFTNSNGTYIFNGLAEGDYTVMVNTPAGQEVSPQDQGTDDTVDSDINDNGMTDPIAVNPSDDINDVDAGISPIDGENASIEGVVFNDDNQDGIQDPNEAPQNAVPVKLLDENGATVANTFTNANGQYFFTGLAAGTYTMMITVPTDDVVSPQDQGTDDTIDSDINDNGMTDPIVLAPGDDINDVDAGISPIDPKDSSIGNRVFEDLDKDGIQDAGEPGVAGVPVKLLDENGLVVATTTTGSTGYYNFFNLEAGTYQVMFTIPTDYTISPQDQGTNDYADSDVDANGMTTPVTVGISESIHTEDAGIYLTDPADASIEGVVFTDDNKDGIQDPTEEGVQNVGVKLLDGNGDVLEITFTNSNGTYIFNGLAEGDYTVMVNTPAGQEVSPQDQGTDDTVDSDINDAGMTEPIALNPSDDINDVDAGISPTDPKDSSIGNRVFEDLDKDGIQDSNEPGVAGVPVKLLDENGLVVATTTTGSTGYYNFFNLEAGTYQVMFTIPTDYTISPQDQGTNDYADSDVDANGMTAPVTVGISESIHTEDAGIYLSDPADASIEGVVFTDDNKDGIQDPTEEGVPNVEVKLLDANGDVLEITFTNSNGAYAFNGLAEGDYTVMVNTPAGQEVSPQDQGTDDTVDSDINNAGMTEPIALNPSDDINDVDAGISPIDPKDSSIGNRVFEDLDKDGIQDSNEPGVAGVPVKLLDENGLVVATTTTGSTGYYNFFNLEAGTYQVMFTLPTEYTISPQDQGTNDYADSDVDADGMTAPVTVGISESIHTEDAGIYLTDPADASIEGVVFTDDNKDGIQDPTEEGLENVEVKLLDADGAVVSTTTTNANGVYTFNGLPEGDYTVMVNTPAGQEVSPQDQGTDDTVDSDINDNGMTDPIAVNPSDDINDVDAGISPIDGEDASIEGIVFNDDNKDGIQDPNEAPQNAVPVKLLDENGATVANTFTNANGQYFFTGLAAGTYTVMITVPTDDVVSPQDQGADDTIDSDINDAGMTEPITLEPGDDVNDVDAGTYSDDAKDASIGNKVFNDLNQDGLQGNDEPGIAGITVTLLDANGTVIGTDVTSTGGWYKFTNLPAGDYQVVIDLPTDFVASPQAQGDDIFTDSDIDATGTTPVITLVESENNITIDAGIFDDSTAPTDPKKIWLEAECGDLGANWVVGNDINASNGDYIVRPQGAGNAYAAPSFTTSPAIATYNFNVDMADTYKIWGRVLTPGSLDDSFWVQVDNGAWIKWNGIPYSDQWQWDDVHNADNNYQMELFDLAAGAHTLRIAYREDGAQLDKILIATPTVVPTNEGEVAGNCDVTPPSNDVCLEAECGDLGADWMTAGDASASNGAYIQSDQPANYNQPTSSSQIASYDFALSETGTYFVWANVQTAGSTGDSFWVRMDGGDWINWNGIKAVTGWTWARVRDAGNGYQVVGFDLAAGTHTLEFAYREAGAIIDKICINQEVKTHDITAVAHNCDDTVNSTTSFELTENNTADEVIETRATATTRRLTATDIKAYPNPTNGLMNLDIETLIGKEVTLTINTVTGQEVLRQQLNTENPITQLDLSSYQDGVYTVFFHVAHEGVLSKKIVILK